MRLRILSPSTCVGLRYGHLRDSLEVFLGSVESASWGTRRSLSSLTSVLTSWRICLPAPPNQGPHTSSRAYAYPSASPLRTNVSQMVQEC